MKLLLTTNHLQDLAGSEIVAMEIVEHFLHAGWKVHVFTNLFGYPIRGHFEDLKKNGRLDISTDLDDDVDLEVDLIWIQHSVVPFKVIEALGKHGLTVPIIWNHMSTIEPMEASIFPDIEKRIADVSAGVSLNLLGLLHEWGIPEKQITLYDNPVPDRFGEAALPPKQDDLMRLALISNHPPIELLHAVEILRKDGIEIDIYGVGAVVHRVTPEMLSRYQGVLTIGKSTQYSLSLGIPVFVYDRFGGEGWLSEENLEREAEFNFSGRSTMRHLDGELLAREISEGFLDAQDYARANRETFAARWRLSAYLEQLLADPRVVNPKSKRLIVSDAFSLKNLSLLRRQLFLHGKDLEDALASAGVELFRVEQELLKIQGTRSWKITLPLRILRDLFNRG